MQHPATGKELTGSLLMRAEARDVSGEHWLPLRHGLGQFGREVEVPTGALWNRAGEDQDGFEVLQVGIVFHLGGAGGAFAIDELKVALQSR